MPTNIFNRSHLLRIDKNFHSFVVKTIRFAQVQHIEANLDRLIVRCSEKVPLRVAASVYIVLQQQVVLIVINFSGSSQVSRFKTTFENDRLVIGSSALIKRFYIYF